MTVENNKGFQTINSFMPGQGCFIMEYLKKPLFLGTNFFKLYNQFPNEE